MTNDQAQMTKAPVMVFYAPREKFQSLEPAERGISNRWKLAAAVLLSCAVSAMGQGTWKVSEAAVRISADVNGTPSPQEAGVIAIIPDGGVLPHPAEAVVFDANGTELVSETVWANPREGFACAFEAPKGDSVTIYIKPGSGQRKKDSPLKPGLMLFTQLGGASLEKGEQMAKQNPPGRDARMGLVGRIGQRENLMGNDDDYSSCYVGWLKIPKDEEIFFCTVSDEGSSFAIDGKTVASWPGLHKRNAGAQGQFGDTVEMSAGFHKVEYFHFEKAGLEQEANFCWRSANDSESAKAPNTVPEKFFTHSATVTIKDARYRDGRTVPMFAWRAASYLWLSDKALCLYHLEIDRADDMPRNAQFSWRIGEYESFEKELNWIVTGDGEQTVELRCVQDNKTASSARSLYLPSTPRNASVNSANDRRDYRQALLARCLAAPKARSPCASWTGDMWLTLKDVVEPYAGNALLEQIFERGRADLGRRPPEERHTIEDIYIENMRYTAPSNVLSWIEKLEQTETDASRKSLWQKRRFQFHLYDLDEPAKARATVDKMRQTASTPDQIARMLICAGDLERMAGNFEQAQKHFVDAADKYRQVRAKSSAPSAGAPAAGEADWRIGAVRVAAYARDVDNLIAQSDWLGARRELDKWEREFPLSKLNGEFCVCEARYYFKIRDYKRAERILFPYVKAVDTAPELPDALQMRFECLMQLDRKSEAAELAADIEKRFPGHSVVEYVTTRAPADLLKKARELLAAPPKALP